MKNSQETNKVPTAENFLQRAKVEKKIKCIENCKLVSYSPSKTRIYCENAWIITKNSKIFNILLILKDENCSKIMKL